MAAAAATRFDKRLKGLGLPEAELPTLERVEQRRLQLWILTFVVIVVVAGASLLGAYEVDTQRFWWARPWVLRGAMFLLALGFCVYAIEKEVHLRRLTRELLEQKALSDALTSRVNELTGLIDASKAVNSVLDLDEVLRIILTSALELLTGSDGSVMLVGPDGYLEVVCAVGNDRARGARMKIGDGIAGRVAASGEPLLLSGDVPDGAFAGHERRERSVPSAMSVPLRNREELLGVLNCNARGDREFTQLDLHALMLFAEQAATAIANARLYELQRQHVEALLEIDHMKNDFITSVSHDLRTPLTSIVGSVAVAMRDDLSDDARREMLLTVRAQADRLHEMVKQLLDAASQDESATPAVPMDLAERIRSVARALAARDMPVTLDVPDRCIVRTNASIDRVIANLIENAHRHGAAPVTLSLEQTAVGAVCTVRDSGPGIDEAARDRVFERFYRADPSRHGSGLGLGLATAKSIVGAHGGSIWVDDNDPGAVVRFRLLSA